jgi:hypothetical protein
MLVFFHYLFFSKNNCCYLYLSDLVSPSTGCKSELFNASVSGNRSHQSFPTLFRLRFWQISHMHRTTCSKKVVIYSSDSDLHLLLWNLGLDKVTSATPARLLRYSSLISEKKSCIIHKDNNFKEILTLRRKCTGTRVDRCQITVFIGRLFSHTFSFILTRQTLCLLACRAGFNARNKFNTKLSSSMFKYGNQITLTWTKLRLSLDALAGFKVSAKFPKCISSSIY